MFLLFEVADQGAFWGVVPETLEILIFGVLLVLLAVALRWLMKRGEKAANGDIKHTTE